MDKNKKKRIVGIGVIAAIAVAVAASGSGVIVQNAEGYGEVTVAASAVTSSINYQGRLTDSTGEPLSGAHEMTFKLYEVDSGGTALDTDTHSVTVTDGLFNTNISFKHSYFDGRELWLGIKVGADAEMMPRQEFKPVPYALSLVPGARIIGSGYTALHAESTHTSGRGIRGYATADSGTNFGVVGASKSPDGYGGYFYNNGGGTGVYGAGKYGGYFTTNQVGTKYAPTAGVRVSTAYGYCDGISASTEGDSSCGIRAFTEGDSSRGVLTRTHGNSSPGVTAYTHGKNSDGVCARTAGYQSAGVLAVSKKYNGISADTGRSDHKYGIYTPDYMYAAKYEGGGSDVAEYFPVAEDPEPGTVMVIGEDSKLQCSTTAYDTTVAGIVSTAPGVSLGTSETGNEGEKLIAVAGRVSCKVDASYAPIKPGDLLTTSDTPGHALKAQPVVIGGVEIYRPGTTIGKALEPLDSGIGVIDVLVTLQ